MSCGERPDGGGDVAAQFHGGLVVIVDLVRQRVDVDHGPGGVGVPQPGVVFHRVVADRDQHIGLPDHDVAGLVLEQPDPADVARFQLSGDDSGRLEGLRHRQRGGLKQGAHRLAGVHVGTAHAHQEHRPGRGPDDGTSPFHLARWRRPQPADGRRALILASVAAAMTSLASTRAATPRGSVIAARNALATASGTVSGSVTSAVYLVTADSSVATFID